MGRHFFRSRTLYVFWGIVFLFAPSLGAQQTPPASRAASPPSGQQGIYLVFPFENAGASPRLDWLGEGLEELTIQDLSVAGQQVYSHAGRIGELERYGLPSAAKISHATMLRIAQDLDADFVVFGTFTSDGTSLTVESRILRVDPPSLLPSLRETSSLDSLMDLQTRMVWRLLTSNDRSYPLSLAEFTKRQRPLRLDAFEHYIRGILANDDEPRLRELREAARLEPDWPDPDFALGETYFSRNDCSSALTWFARVPKTHSRYASALFSTGVCQLQLNQPEKAEEVFLALQTALRNQDANGTGGDLPEILNNLGIARERQGKTPAALADLRRAADIDPDEDDYSFNLGLLAMRAGDYATAEKYFREAAEREPDTAEDRALLIQCLEKEGKKDEADQERDAAAEALGPNALPAIRGDVKGDAVARLERIKTELDLIEIRAEAESPPLPAAASQRASQQDTPASLIRRGRLELSNGRTDAAESEFQAALKADPANASAHRELAEIDRKRGKLDDAVRELQASLKARDSAAVRTTLARIYLEQKKPELARAEAERALKLAPNYGEAKQLLEHLQNSKPGGGAQ